MQIPPGMRGGQITT